MQVHLKDDFLSNSFKFLFKFRQLKICLTRVILVYNSAHCKMQKSSVSLILLIFKDIFSHLLILDQPCIIYLCIQTVAIPDFFIVLTRPGLSGFQPSGLISFCTLRFVQPGFLQKVVWENYLSLGFRFSPKNPERICVCF